MNVFRLMDTCGTVRGNCQLEDGVLGHAHLGKNVICFRDEFDEPTVVHEMAHILSDEDHGEKFSLELDTLNKFCGVSPQ